MTEWTRQEFPQDLAITYGAHDSGNATMPEVFYGPAPVPTVPRWWYTTDDDTLYRIRFLPDYEPLNGDMVVVGMRAAWGDSEMDLCCDRETGTYFRKDVTSTGTVYGKVFAPAPPPIGTWSGECP